MSGRKHLLIGLVIVAAAASACKVAHADEFGELPKSWQGSPPTSAAQGPAATSGHPVTDFRKIMREAAPLSQAEAAEPPPPHAAASRRDGGPAPAPNINTGAEPDRASAVTDLDAADAQSRVLTEHAAPPLQRGLAAWYQHKGVTASGELYKPDGLTAAHRTLPLGTRLRVRYEKTGKEVTVRVNDRVSRKALQRRPLAIELSRASAEAIGLNGIGRVAIYQAD